MLFVRIHLVWPEANSVLKYNTFNNTTYTGIRKDKKVFLTPFYPLWTGKDKILLSNKTGFSADLIDWLPLWEPTTQINWPKTRIVSNFNFFFSLIAWFSWNKISSSVWLVLSFSKLVWRESPRALRNEKIVEGVKVLFKVKLGTCALKDPWRRKYYLFTQWPE